MNRDFLTKIDLIGALVADLDDKVNTDCKYEAAYTRAEATAQRESDGPWVDVFKYLPKEYHDYSPMTNAHLNRRLMVIRELCLDLIKEDYNVSCG